MRVVNFLYTYSFVVQKKKKCVKQGILSYNTIYFVWIEVIYKFPFFMFVNLCNTYVAYQPENILSE